MEVPVPNPSIAGGLLELLPRRDGRHCQVGSLAGVTHLLKDNAGVLR
ncbi:unnamed protein product, partial [Vitis vinifera]